MVIQVESLIEDQMLEKKSKRRKRKKKNYSDDELTSGEKKAKKKKKRKASDEETSYKGSDDGEKIKLMEKEEEDENPNALSKFRISEAVGEKLKSKGIEALFPIQAMAFNVILDGSDLVGRARTGQGKTLAFVLPILESLTNGPCKASREHAKQVI